MCNIRIYAAFINCILYKAQGDYVIIKLSNKVFGRIISDRRYKLCLPNKNIYVVLITILVHHPYFTYITLRFNVYTIFSEFAIILTIIFFIVKRLQQIIYNNEIMAWFDHSVFGIFFYINFTLPDKGWVTFNDWYIHLIFFVYTIIYY